MFVVVFSQEAYTLTTRIVSTTQHHSTLFASAGFSPHGCFRSFLGAGCGGIVLSSEGLFRAHYVDLKNSGLLWSRCLRAPKSAKAPDLIRKLHFVQAFLGLSKCCSPRQSWQLLCGLARMLVGFAFSAWSLGWCYLDFFEFLASGNPRCTCASVAWMLFGFLDCKSVLAEPSPQY